MIFISEELKSKLEKMLDIEIDEVKEEGDKVQIDIDEDKIGKAIGFQGSNIRAAEKALGKEIEVLKEK